MGVDVSETDPGMTPTEAIAVLRHWRDYVRAGNPFSAGDRLELADDMRACADVLEAALSAKPI